MMPLSPSPAAASLAAPSIAGVDIHCHILPEIDDGPANFDQAVALCRCMWREGITTAVATPHQLGRYGILNTPKRIRELVQQLRERLAQRRIGIDIVAGAEVRLDERIDRLLIEDAILTLADGRSHILIELPPELSLEPQAVLPRVNSGSNSTQVVLAHAERYGFIRKDPAAAKRWADAGVLVQINSGSLVGAYGPAEQQSAWQLLTSGVATIVATDAHNLTSRLPHWSTAVRQITERLGAAVAAAVCSINPGKIAASRASATTSSGSNA